MGCFITFEGIEGCGKSTQVKLLLQHLLHTEHDAILTREPGGCPIADKIRSILLDSANNNMTPLTELLLYAAARAQHVNEVIATALGENKIVLCDRFTDATLSYQGYARGLDLNTIDYLNKLATGGVTPDLTVLLDCPVEVGLSRAISPVNSHGIKEERFELESMQFHQKVREGYLHLASLSPNRFVIIDADQYPAKVASDVTKAVMAKIAELA
jgi:dTMP kinase